MKSSVNNIKLQELIIAKAKNENKFLIEVLPWIKEENSLIEGGMTWMDERGFYTLDELCMIIF